MDTHRVAPPEVRNMTPRPATSKFLTIAVLRGQRPEWADPMNYVASRRAGEWQALMTVRKARTPMAEHTAWWPACDRPWVATDSDGNIVACYLPELSACQRNPFTGHACPWIRPAF